MKIYIPILGFGKAGGYRVLSQLANQWISKGCEVYFIDPIGQPPYYPTSASIIYVGKPNKKNSVLFKLYLLNKKLRELVKNDDIILANHSFTAWSVAFSNKGKKFYYVQAYEPEFYDKKFALGKGISGYIKRFMSRKSYFFDLKKIVNANIYADSHASLNGAPVIPPGIDLELMKPAPFDNHLKAGVIIGCIGREDLWKGTDDVITAYKKIKEKMPQLNIKLKVAFHLPFEYSDDAGIELVQPDGDQNLAAFYQSLDILIAPGHIQLGAVHYPVMEGLACGVQVIHTGYLPGSNENSWIVAPKCPNEIALKIEYILGGSRLCLVKKERALKDVEKYSWENVGQTFLNHFG